MAMDNTVYLEALSRSYLKFLDRLGEQLELYSDEALMWQVSGDVSNSSGNLAVHILGNLNHFIGAVLGNSGYERDRPLEFSVKGKSRDEIIAEIEATKKVLGEVIPNLSNETLNSEFPQKFGDENPSTHEWLIQCNTHIAYHLGQINYHRRLLDNA